MSQMHGFDPNLIQFNRRILLEGFLKLSPLSVFAVLFGAAFGMAAQHAGLEGWVTLAMSALIFAGASQFAALDMWGTHVSVLAIAITVFAINSRHLLMGAALYPWLRHLPASRRYGVMLLTSDASWLMSVQAFNKGLPGIGLLLGGGLMLWLSWFAGTWLGMNLGGSLQSPEQFGLDMVMGCFLLAIAVGGEKKNMRTLLVWCVAATASLGAYRYLPENSHIITGALAGGIAGVLYPETGT